MLKLKGSIKISGDKSISHRALIFASLSTGKVKISNLLESDDVMRTLNILKELGINNVTISKSCTYNDNFYSYRKDKTTGRFVSLIWFKK